MSTYYIYNSNTGNVMKFDDITRSAAALYLTSGQGWHGTTGSGPGGLFASFPEVQAYYDANKAANPGWKAPKDNSATTPQQDIAGAVNAGTNDFLGSINVQSWLLRIGEMILGIVLLGVGLAHLTGASNAVSKALKVVPLPI